MVEAQRVQDQLHQLRKGPRVRAKPAKWIEPIRCASWLKGEEPEPLAPPFCLLFRCMEQRLVAFEIDDDDRCRLTPSGGVRRTIPADRLNHDLHQAHTGFAGTTAADDIAVLVQKR